MANYRSIQLPYFAKSEAALRQRYPFQLALPGVAPVARIRLAKSKSVGGGDEIFRDTVFAWLTAGGRRVGAIEMHEFDANGCADADEFIDFMGESGAADGELAVVLAECWPDLILDISHAGPILELRTAWIDQAHSRRGTFAKVANAVIDNISYWHSILVMRTELIEVAGRPTPSCLRQRALARHLCDIFGVRPLPGKFGRQGWLWRPNPQAQLKIPKPRARVRW